jgi:hypothetical protein
MPLNGTVDMVVTWVLSNYIGLGPLQLQAMTRNHKSRDYIQNFDLNWR